MILYLKNPKGEIILKGKISDLGQFLLVKKYSPEKLTIQCKNW